MGTDWLSSPLTPLSREVMLSERASWRLQAAVSSVREARGEDEFGLPGGDLRLLTQHGLLQSEDEVSITL